MSREIYYISCPSCGQNVELAFDVVECVFLALCETCRFMSPLEDIKTNVTNAPFSRRRVN